MERDSRWWNQWDWMVQGFYANGELGLETVHKGTASMSAEVSAHMSDNRNAQTLRHKIVVTSLKDPSKSYSYIRDGDRWIMTFTKE